MIKIEVNNKRQLQITQDHDTRKCTGISIDTVSSKGKIEDNTNISNGDFVMLINYYKYIKDNNFHCDFINTKGV